MLKKWMRNKKGYVSIETVIVAGLVIALGAFAMQEFYGAAQNVVGASIDRMDVEDVILKITIVGGIEEVEL
ncbi:hypothetical protein [Paenibacillus sp. FSL H8-0283]|uniref:hypothetical protein n=1 Tax=Paenibacillus sp. FSL H8-0283 TaxID=2921383 RepID=UPI003255B400